MSVAILGVYQSDAGDKLFPDIFHLSGPQSVKDHVTQKAKENGGGDVHWEMRNTVCKCSNRIDLYLLISWIERNFRKLEHVSSAGSQYGFYSQYVFHR